MGGHASGCFLRLRLQQFPNIFLFFFLVFAEATYCKCTLLNFPAVDTDPH